MESYKPNSHKSKAEEKEPEKEKKIEKVVTGEVISKKKSGMRKFGDVFLSEDVSNVKNYIFTDILLPAGKKVISDVVTNIVDTISDVIANGIEMALYGEVGKSRSKSTSSRHSYTEFYERPGRTRMDPVQARIRTAYDIDDIIVKTRGDAEDVLSRMAELIATYGTVSVADLYEMVGKTGTYTDNNYGWTDVRTGSPVRLHDGYLLRLPRPMPLD